MPNFAHKALSSPALLLSAYLLAASAFSSTAVAQAPSTEAKRDPRIDAVLDNLGKVRGIYQTAISPDGKFLAWVVAGEAGGKHGGTEIEVAPLATPDKPTRATAGTKGALCQEGDIAWSPDSKTLAFLSDCQAAEDNKGQRDFYLADFSHPVPNAKSTPRRLTHLQGIAEAPSFSPDGKQLGFLYVEGATRSASPLAAEKSPAGVIGEDGLEVKGVAIIDTPLGLASHVMPTSENGKIIALPVCDRKFTPIVTPIGLYVYEFDWSPDSSQIAFVAAQPPGENNWWVAQLYTETIRKPTDEVCGGLSIATAPTSILDPVSTPGPLHGLQIAVPRWSPDGKQIAFIGGLMSDQGATGGDIYTVPVGRGTAKPIIRPLQSSATWFAWRSHTPKNDAHYDEDSWIVSEIRGGSSAIVGYTSTGPISCAGKSETVPCSDGAYLIESAPPNISNSSSIGDGRLEGSLSLADDGKLAAYVQSSFGNAPEVYAGPIEKASQITHYNDNLKPSWGKAESIAWTSAVQPSPTIPPTDSTKDFNVQGWLLYPANYDPGKKYPLIVYVHGGPSAAELPHWPGVGFGPAPFAALGYFVLMPNPRGSYGQGEAFTAANRKDFGYGDLRDILAAIDPANADAVTKSHNIDPERVGITGWSYGGFMTMFAVTQTNRFRAAVAGAGISNWQSYYGENAIDQWMIPFFGASVYDDPGVYAKMSAINFIKQVKTPTLAVVGDRDGECPAPQSFEFWHALKAQHVPTQLVVYPNEGHGFTSPEHQRDVIARSLDWFQKYMPAN